MRPLLFLVLLAILVALVVRTPRALLPPRRNEVTAPPRWRAAHWSSPARTHVGVQCAVERADGRTDVVDRREMTSIPDDAPDYELRFSDAMAAARVRADVLNAEGDD